MGLISGLGRSFGGGPGNLLQWSCLEYLMDRGVHGVTQSRTWLKLLSMHARGGARATHMKWIKVLESKIGKILIRTVSGTKMKNNQEFLLNTDSNKVFICSDAGNSSNVIQSVVHVLAVVHDQWGQ